MTYKLFPTNTVEDFVLFLQEAKALLIWNIEYDSNILSFHLIKSYRTTQLQSWMGYLKFLV